MARENCKDLSWVVDYGQDRWVKRRRWRGQPVESGEHVMWSGNNNEVSSTREDELSWRIVGKRGWPWGRLWGRNHLEGLLTGFSSWLPA